MAKRGRPTLPEGERRDIIRSFVVNPKEDQLLEELVNHHGISMSNAIRYCIGSIHDLTFREESVATPEDYR